MDTVLGATTPAEDVDGSGVSRVLATSFTSDTGGSVVGIRYYHPAANGPTTIIVGLFRTSDHAELARKATATAGFTTNAWNTVTLDTPVAISSATEYVAAVWISGTNGHFVDTPSGLASNIVNGHLTGKANLGRYKNFVGDLVWPDGGTTSYLFFVDPSVDYPTGDPAITPATGFAAQRSGPRLTAGAAGPDLVAPRREPAMTTRTTAP